MTLYFEMICSRKDEDVNNVNQNVLLNVDSLVLTDHACCSYEKYKSDPIF